MSYNFLLDDLKKNLSQKAIGTDKGLAKIGDSIVNLTYSIAKSVYLSESFQNKIIRTGNKVSKTILAHALKEANMKNFARSRADAHGMADTVEAIVAYVYLNNNMTLTDIINTLLKKIDGDLSHRQEEIKIAQNAFLHLLNNIKKFLPEK